MADSSGSPVAPSTRIGSMAPAPVHVALRLTESLSEADVDAIASTLSPDEQERARAFVFFRDRRDYVAAHGLLRETLSKVSAPPSGGWTFTAGRTGKPAIAETSPRVQLSFNLSHTRGLVACAVSLEHELGIDVECIDRSADRTDVARHNFASVEHAQLEVCATDERAERFVEIWTLKEAFVKATGTGIVDDLQGWGFRLDVPGCIIFDSPAGTHAEHWTFGLFAPTTETRMALAVRTSSSVAPDILAPCAAIR